MESSLRSLAKLGAKNVSHQVRREFYGGPSGIGLSIIITIFVILLVSA
jgi:hypothetical protein